MGILINVELAFVYADISEYVCGLGVPSTLFTRPLVSLDPIQRRPHYCNACQCVTNITDTYRELNATRPATRHQHKRECGENQSGNVRRVSQSRKATPVSVDLDDNQAA